MPTIADLDKKLENKKHEIAQLEERKKALIAKEREQARKWKAATVAALGEMLLGALGNEWTSVDLDALSGWLAENEEALRTRAVIDARTPVEAKKALDAFKKPSKQAKETDVAQPTPTPDVQPPVSFNNL